MTTMQAPTFGCPKCAAPNPRDDQLCVDCMRAKLSYLNAISVGGYADGTRVELPADVSQPGRGPAVSAPARAGAALGLSSLRAIMRISPGWYFVLAFVIFFMISGRGMMPGSVEAPRSAPVSNYYSSEPEGLARPARPMAPTAERFDGRGRAMFDRAYPASSGR